MSARLIHLAGREDDCRSVLSAQLMRHTDACTGHFEIDVYERYVRPLAARQLQRLVRRVRWPEDCKASLFEHRRGTEGDDCFIFDDQYYHHSFASSQNLYEYKRQAPPRVPRCGGASENYR